MATTLRVAVTQAEPVYLNLEESVKKACDLIAEAAKNGAKLVAFSECWVPGYPAWIWYPPFSSLLLFRPFLHFSRWATQLT